MFIYISKKVGEIMIELNNVSTGYDNIKVINDVSFNVKKNELFCIIGTNGSGKTTLLKAIANINKYSGSIKINGKEIKNINRKELAKEIALMSQITEVYFTYTVFETISLGRYPHMKGFFGGLSEKDRNIIDKIIKDLSLDNIKDKYINELSGGQLQRVLLARTFVQDPKIILLDEPTNHLDAFSREELENTLLNYSGTMLIVSHDRYFINKLATRIVELTPNGCNNFLGNYDDYSEHRYVSEVKKEEKQKPKVNDYKLKKERQSNLRKLNTLLKRLEEEIDETENEIGKYESELSGAEYEKLMEYTSKIDELSKKRDVLYEKWENASLELAQLEEE